MLTVDWYFDFISPFAYLQWVRLQNDYDDIALRPHPILFAGLLKHWGQLGPAEIAPKRIFTYRHVVWRARQAEVPFSMPSAHPFNPLRFLRLAVAADCRTDAIDRIFRFIWAEDGDLEDDAAFEALGHAVDVKKPLQAVAGTAVKNRLIANTEQAVRENIFGVPTLLVHGEPFWGEDATDLAMAVARNPDLLQEETFQKASNLPVGIQRR